MKARVNNVVTGALPEIILLMVMVAVLRRQSSIGATVESCSKSRFGLICLATYLVTGDVHFQTQMFERADKRRSAPLMSSTKLGVDS